MDSLVTTDQVAEKLGAPDLRIIDATYFTSLPGDPPRDAAAEFEAAHIPGAVFLDLASLVDKSNPLPATFPTRDQVANRLQELGIGDGFGIIIYDNSPLRTSARAWWLLQLYGVTNVAILDGGLPKWRAEGREIANGPAATSARPITLDPHPHRLRTIDQMRANLDRRCDQVLDARSAARFTGEESDPRPSIASGHIPRSRNLPFGQLFNPDGTYKDRVGLKSAFDAAGVDPARPLVMTCGSGITASVLAFAAHLLGNQAAVYDGSWTEWGGDPTTPKATGAA